MTGASLDHLAKIVLRPAHWRTAIDPSYVGACVTEAMQEAMSQGHLLSCKIDRTGMTLIVPVDGRNGNYLLSQVEDLTERMQKAVDSVRASVGEVNENLE